LFSQELGKPEACPTLIATDWPSDVLEKASFVGRTAVFHPDIVTRRKCARLGAIAQIAVGICSPQYPEPDKRLFSI
jgi:hypothetical protein